MRYTYARYFPSSRRTGLALPYLRENLEFWRKRNVTLQVFLALDGLASAFNDMGETGLRDHYREQALALAADYFVPGGKPSNAHEWLQYKRVIDNRMDNMASSGRVQEIERWWPAGWEITECYLAPKVLSYPAILILTPRWDTTRKMSFKIAAKWEASCLNRLKIIPMWEVFGRESSK